MPGSYAGMIQATIGVDGHVYFQEDSGTSSSQSFQARSTTISYTDGISFPLSVDGTARSVNEVLGVSSGTLSQEGFISIDRAWQTLINDAFGPRTGGHVNPWNVQIADSAASTPYTMAGLWFGKFGLSGSYGRTGADAALTYSLSGIVTDKNNLHGNSVTTPSITGVTGTNLSTMNSTSFTNGSSITYTGIRNFQLSLDSNLMTIPANDASYASSRLSAGCVLGPMTAETNRLSITQLIDNSGSEVVLPMTIGSTIPINIVIPDAAADHTLTIGLSLTFIDKQKTNTPGDRKSVV